MLKFDFNKVAKQLYFDMSVLLYICCTSSEQLFLRKLLMGCFWIFLNLLKPVLIEKDGERQNCTSNPELIHNLKLAKDRSLYSSSFAFL